MKTLDTTHTSEYSLLNSEGKKIAMGTQNQMFAYIKHHVEDGRYRIVGPELRLHCLRENGIVMPDPDGVCLMAKEALDE